MIKLLSSLLPAVFLLIFIYWKDKNPEPLPLVLKAFGLGVLSTFLAVLVEIPLEALGDVFLARIPILGSAYRAFFVAALPEETCKLFMLWLFLRQNKEFDEYIDGIVYSVAIGLGFAAFENVGYVFGAEDADWGGIAFFRAFLAVPGHYAFAVLMGFFYSLNHFMSRKYFALKSLILISPVIAHGIYDMILMVMGEDIPVLSVLLSFLLIAFVVRMHKYCYKRIGTLIQLDKDREHIQRFVAAMK